MKKDYKELEGVIIDLEWRGKDYKAKVIGCNFDIGITIIDNDEPTRKFLCLNGPSSKFYKSAGSDSYMAAFHAVIGMIYTGCYKMGLVDKLYLNNTGDIPGGMADCPYSGE